MKRSITFSCLNSVECFIQQKTTFEANERNEEKYKNFERKEGKKKERK